MAPDGIPPGETPPVTPQQAEAFQRFSGLRRHADSEQAVMKRLAPFIGVPSPAVQHETVPGAEPTIGPQPDPMAELRALLQSSRPEVGGEEAAGEPPEPWLATEMHALQEQMGGQFGQLESGAQGRLMTYMRQRHQYQTTIAAAEDALLKRMLAIEADPQLRDSQTAWKSLDLDRQDIQWTRQKLDEELPRQSPEAFLAHNVLKLREYKQQLKTGIVETPYVAQLHDKIVDKLVKGRIVALVGETGTGKTVMARKIGIELTDGFEFIAGHGMMDKTDLLYSLGLSAERTAPEDVPGLIEEAQARFRAKYQDLELPAEQLVIAEAQIERILSGQAEHTPLKTETLLGPLYKAAKEGKVCIIDEWNFIPPQAMASIYAAIEARPGSVITVAGETFTVRPGFGVILTGNITQFQAGRERYLNRQELDPGFINRLNSGLIQYNTPPQEIDTAFEAGAVLSQDQLSAGEKPPERDLFLIGLSHLADMKGNLQGTADTLPSLWRLSKSFSLFQKLYAGENIRGVTDQPGTKFNLKTYHASLRSFGSILEQWKKSAYGVDLDWFIYDSLIRPAALIAPTEAAQFFYLLQNREGFFTGEAWQGVAVDPTRWAITGLETLRGKSSDDFRRVDAAPVKYYLPREVAEAASGLPTPVYDEAGLQQATEHRGHEAQFRELQRQYDELEARIKAFTGYDQVVGKDEEGEDIVEHVEGALDLFCGDEAAIMGAAA